MQKSFIERVFPKPKKALLPQYDTTASYHDEPQRGRSEGAASTSGFSDSRDSVKSTEADSRLQPAPMSASIIHHEDPFLAVDRAAQNLQRTIQSLLDFQNEALSGRHREDGDTVSRRSLTPTQSAHTGSFRNLSASGATPIRQPAKKKTTLKGARRGIGRSMHDFAILKEEELKITENERAHRRAALDKIVAFETKRESVQHEVNVLQQSASGDASTALRQEAQSVQDEIHELEGRLMELKTKHRHLTNQAEQLENSAASQLSSYQGALNLIDKEVRTFLRHPPVKQGLGPRSIQEGQDMYTLRPERRSLELARQQWVTELEVLEQHKVDTERERDALVEGAKIWREAIQHIDDFEQLVRARMKSSTSDPASTSDIVTSLDNTMHFLEHVLQEAETKDWKLLICAIGPELDAFRQARSLLVPDEPLTPMTEPNGHTTNGSVHTDHFHTDEEDADVPHADLLEEQPPGLSFRPTIDYSASHDDHEHGFAGAAKSNSSSNESLKATLRNLSSEPSNRQQAPFSMGTSSGKLPERRGARYSESEDDEPGPDFLLSH